VVLREQVESLGERGEVVNVAPGYARNFLLPKGLAYAATPGNLKTLEDQRRRWTDRAAREVNEARALAARIEALELEVTRKAGESGTLYGSVTSSEVAELLAAKGVEVDRRRLTIGEPIKIVGDHAIPLKLHPQVTATIRLRVLAQASAE
jgi:large subunit ribosomal protein L9